MRFGPVLLSEAEGAILAHSLRYGRKILKKGHRLAAGDIAALRAAGLSEVIAARLEADDVPEDAAAAAVARAAAGEGTRLAPAFTGRGNIHATVHGLAVIDRERLDRVNLMDEALTVASVAPFEVVEAGQLLATVKVIPLAASRSVVEAASALAASDPPLVRVAAFRAHDAGLLLTRLPGFKESILDKTVKTARARIEALGSRLAEVVRCDHEEGAVAEAIAGLMEKGCAPILIFGASAIIDRRDVVPAAIERAGGAVDHFGMPVDPGNLLLLAHCGATPVLGLPGSARSARVHGFDWVLQRLLAGLRVTGHDLMLLGAGGLLKEIQGRPQPRERRPAGRAARPAVAALVLAAGQSRRMGRVNKLLSEIDGRPMVARTVDAVLASRARPVVVVVGHQAERVRAALAGRDIRIVDNPDYAAGLSTSLRQGLEALGDEPLGALICLGDMPRIEPGHLDALIDAFAPAEGRAICVPTRDGKRGNPVLWGAAFFADMKRVAGDVGARHLIGEHAELVHEVPIEDDAIFVDIDTPEALTALKAGKTAR